ncbi:MAG: tetratricopeptide repeat protein [Methyloceanibacter sp.]|uniref:tetratricopeptide repeat protein n=1 Tax=Methyloceanibacter sp. TaxID=1965321 RepID=UPI003D6CC826
MATCRANVLFTFGALAIAGFLALPWLVTAPPALAQVYLDSLGDDEPEESDEPALHGPEDAPGAEEETPGAEPLLRPDTKGSGEEAAPPQSAEETKQDKLDLELGNVPLITPLDRPKMLAELYEQLGKARNIYDAEPIMKAIEELWTVSGSDTVDLLMSRATQFASEADLELSLAVLDAVVDIAPEEAEAWYLRAKVNVLAGKPERALADLRRALNLDPKHYRAISDLGIVLEQLGAKKEALEAYRRALAVNPFMEDARQGVEALAREVEGQDI